MRLLRFEDDGAVERELSRARVAVMQAAARQPRRWDITRRNDGAREISAKKRAVGKRKSKGEAAAPACTS